MILRVYLVVLKRLQTDVIRFSGVEGSQITGGHLNKFCEADWLSLRGDSSIPYYQQLGSGDVEVFMRAVAATVLPSDIDAIDKKADIEVKRLPFGYVEQGESVE